MITRMAKLLLLAGVAFFYSLVVFNNLTDFNSNYQLVRHVLMMDTTFPGNHGMWRALTLSLLMWLVAFISVGGEWFLMWQSQVWNGEETAFRDFTMVGIVLVVFMFPERDVQP